MTKFDTKSRAELITMLNERQKQLSQLRFDQVTGAGTQQTAMMYSQ